jgi:hypothetical protein
VSGSSAVATGAAMTEPDRLDGPPEVLGLSAVRPGA